MKNEKDFIISLLEHYETKTDIVDIIYYFLFITELYCIRFM